MKNHSHLTTALILGAALFHLHAAGTADGFKLKDTAGEHLDILQGERLVGRFMYAYDKSSPARLHETYKPYLHVFDAEGQAPITKGPGGQFTHHRGIFVGWNKLGFNGKNYDRWHMKGGEQVHQKFLAQEADQTHATFTSLIFWNDEKGEPILEEERTMTFRPAPAPAYVIIDFSTRLKASRGDVMLDGDPEHAGVQFRPANEVKPKETVYVFPKEGAKPTSDLDYPWVGETFTLGEKRHSVIEINHPENPKGTRFSAYRDYGRFGAFFKAPIKSGETLSLQYRFLVAAGEMPPIAVIQECYNQFAGVTAPVPKTTAIGAAAKKAASNSNPKKK